MRLALIFSTIFILNCASQSSTINSLMSQSEYNQIRQEGIDVGIAIGSLNETLNNEEPKKEKEKKRKVIKLIY
jgi:hypothetical protein